MLVSHPIGVGSTGAVFGMAYVMGSGINNGVDCSIGAGYSNKFIEIGGSGALLVHPVINLPSNIKVEEIEGEWNILD